MSKVALYVISAALLVVVAMSAWVVVAGLRHRRIEWGAVVTRAACIVIGYFFAPEVLPAGPLPRTADGFTVHYDIRDRGTWIIPGLVGPFFVLALSAECLYGAVKSYRERHWIQVWASAAVDTSSQC